MHNSAGVHGEDAKQGPQRGRTLELSALFANWAGSGSAGQKLPALPNKQRGASGGDQGIVPVGTVKNEQKATSEQESAFIRIWTCEENTYDGRTQSVHYGSLSSQMDDDEEPDVMLQDTVYKRMLANLLEEAYARGYKTARVKAEFEVKNIQLRATPERIRIRKEYHEHQARLKREDALIDEIRQRVELECATGTPSSEMIAEFYERWGKSNGYRKIHDRVETGIKPALVAYKEKIIETVLERAKRENWPYGIQRDSKARGKFDHVIYIDSPYGQISWHVQLSKYDDLPKYKGKWTGNKGESEAALGRLFGDEPR